MIDSLQTIVNNFVNSQMDRADEDIRKSISHTNKELVNELKKMYRSFMEQFYSYKTTSYIRHGTSRPGTKNGYALKRAANIYAMGGRMPRLVIEISGDRIGETYEYDDADSVLDFVMNGIRFTGAGIVTGKYHPHRKGEPWEWTMTWEPPYYEGKYFQYHSTVQEAFDAFDNDFEDIAMNMVRDKMRDYGWR